MAYTIGAIVRGDLWGRFFDFRPRGWWKTRERTRARHASSCHPFGESQEIQLNYRERQRVKGRLSIYLRRKIRRGMFRETPPSRLSSKGERTRDSRAVFNPGAVATAATRHRRYSKRDNTNPQIHTLVIPAQINNNVYYVAF